MSRIGSFSSDVNGVEVIFIRDKSPLQSEPKILEQKFDFEVVNDQLDALNIEALEALEENLKHQLEILMCREKQFEDMTE